VELNQTQLELLAQEDRNFASKEYKTLNSKTN